MLVTVLAVLQVCAGTFLGIAALALVVTGAMADDGAGALIIIGVVLAAIAALQLVCGAGLWTLRPYGRITQLTLAWIGLLAIPFGTLISILILVYLLKPGSRTLFSGKAAAELTAQELANIDALNRSSVATAVAIVVVLLVIVSVPIMAAIALPGLLKARTAGNEARAIGAMRAIASAQATFAAACGNGFYAPSLSALARAPQGGIPFISPDLGEDPSAKSGYVIRVTPGDPVREALAACNGAAVVRSFFASASPEQPGASGVRYFGLNPGGTIYQSSSEMPNAQEGTPAGARALF